MSIIPQNKGLIKSLIAASIFTNFIAVILIFTPLKPETKRNHNQLFFPNNVKVTNTLINLIEKKNLTITRAELNSAIDSSSETKDLFTTETSDKKGNQNSYGRLHFSLIQNTEIVNKVWIEIPSELPVNLYE